MVGKFVAFVVVVAAHPNEGCLGLSEQRTDFFDDIEVLNLSPALLPAFGFPGDRPFGDDINPEFTVRINLTLFAGSILEGSHDGKTFHTDIGRVVLTAQ